MTAPPTLSYTIWFTQRNGSTLLTKALEQTGLVGRPREWMNNLKDHSLLSHYAVSDPNELLPNLWSQGKGKNGVYGQKVSMHGDHLRKLLEELTAVIGLQDRAELAEVWEHAFPNHRYLFLTRRNKVRQAVSWWKAIQTQEWHRVAGSEKTAQPDDLLERYDFDAIRHLMMETLLREAAINDFLSQTHLQPMTIVYEDFVGEYEGTIKRVLTFLGQDAEAIPISPPPLSRLADEISEQWVQRFRQEIQADWDTKAW